MANRQGGKGKCRIRESKKKRESKYNKSIGSAFSNIGFWRARKGRMEEAKQAFSRAKSVALREKNRIERDLILRDIAYREAESNLFEDSLETIGCIRIKENKNWAVARLAGQIAYFGDAKRAKKVSSEIENSAILCPLLSELAEIEASEGKFNCAAGTILRARKKAREIENEEVKGVALCILDDIERQMHSDLQKLCTKLPI